MTEPDLEKTEFNCPSCGTLARQTWLACYAERITNQAGVPLRIRGADLERLANNPQYPPEVREQKVDYWNRVNGGAVFLERWAPVHTDVFVAGMELSFCNACGAVAVWLGGDLVHPSGKETASA